MKNLSKQLFRVKSLHTLLAETHDQATRLKKALGPFDLILLGIGAIIGAGIFATVGTAAAGDALRPGAGPALILSFAITAVACGFSALCYAELASLVPVSGSAFTYAYATFGELVAWIIGWDLIIEYGVGAIAVSISWSGYFLELLRGFGLSLPAWATIDMRSAVRGFEAATALLNSGTPFTELDHGLQHTWQAVHDAPHVLGVPVVCNIPAIIIVALLTMILIVGIKSSTRFNAIMVAIKLLVLGFFICVGIFYVKPDNWVPFAPNGFIGIRAGAAIVFFAYIGFDCVSTVAEETRNPRRDMPIGIIGSLIICTIVYMIVAAVFTGIMPFSVLQTSLAHEKAEPLTLAMQHINLPWAAGIVAFGSVIAHVAVLLVLMLGQARIFFSMARDGLLPSMFSRVHRKFRTPYITTIVIGIVVALFAACTNIEEMVDLTNIGTLFAFTLVCFGVIVLRLKEPHRHRPFKVPFSPITPLLGVIACVFLITGLPAVTWVRFFLWLALGLVVYFAYGFRHSLLHKAEHARHEVRHHEQR
jgi:APA family basic amino acid/polyamine antiporter